MRIETDLREKGYGEFRQEKPNEAVRLCNSGLPISKKEIVPFWESYVSM